MAALTELLGPSPFSLRRWQTNAICRMHFYSRLAQERRSYPWCQGQCGLLLSHHQQTKSWLRPRFAIVPPPSKGEGSSTVCGSLSSHRRAMWKPAYWLCQLLSSPAGGNKSFACVKQQPLQSPDVSTGVHSTSIITAIPSRNATQHKKWKMSGIRNTLLLSSLVLHSQPIWNKPWPQQNSHMLSCPLSKDRRDCSLSFFHPYLVVYMFPGNLSSSFQAWHNLYRNGSFQRSFQSNDLCRFSL